MSDREIYSHSGSLASLVSDLKNGQRGIDSDSGDWIYRDYSGVLHASRSYKSYSGSVWNYNAIPTGLTGNRGLVTDSSGNLAASAVTSTELGYLSGKNSVIDGSGTANYISKFSAGGRITNSIILDNGSNVGIGITNPQQKLHVEGNSYISGSVGIGTSSPQYTLDVYGNGNFSSGLTVSDLTASRVLVTDANKKLISSAVTSTELGYLSGVTSAVQTQLDGKLSGSGTTGRIPYFTSGSALGNSNLYFGGKSVRLMAAPSNWGINFATIELGLNAIWANYAVQDGFGLIFSNNIYHDGTGNKPYVNGLALSYCQNFGIHSWTSDQSLVAGTIFTPTERMRLDFNGLFLQSLNASRVVVTDSSGYLMSSSVTSTELGYLSGVTSAVQTQLDGKISASGLTANYLPMYNGSSLVNSVFQQSASMLSGMVGQFRFGNSSLYFVNSGYTNTVAGWCCNAELKEVGGILVYHSVVSGSVGILRNNGSNFEFCINTATSAGQQLVPDVKMRISATGLFLSGLTADTVLVANASRYVTSSAVTLTELNLLSGKTGLVGGSGTAGQFPIFTASGSVGDSYFSYIAGSSTYLWSTASIAELMSLTPSRLWINTKLFSNGLSTGDATVISFSSSTYSIDVSALTQFNIKLNASTSSTIALWRATIGDIIYLTNISTAGAQINVRYDWEGAAMSLYPGQTAQLVCINTYGSGSIYSTWAIWRTDTNPSSHIDD